uniref:CUB-like domain-containing protein n=1 Tax=Caenorhabditis japonica TaxID=281687 RepID=A0A8R1HMK8_CAEJA
MARTCLFTFALFTVCTAQKLVELNSFQGENTKNYFSSTGTFGIYVSAYSDTANVLKQIFVVTDDQKQISLYDLKSKKLFQTSGELQPYPVTQSAYVTTSLSSKQLSSLNGVMFVSTSKQLNDKNFHVYDIDTNHLVNLSGDLTVVFLNTHIDTSPIHSTLISNWKQDENAIVFMYKQYPTDSAEQKNSQIFANPIIGYDWNKFSPTVETFSLSFKSFYIKTHGSLQFNIGPGYYDVNGKTTTSYTTTGFYMKTANQSDRTITIHTARDTKYTGKTGANTIGELSQGGKVDVGEYDNSNIQYQDSTSFPPSTSIFFWTSRTIGETFQISSTNAQSGYFCVQYFVIQNSTPGQTTVLPGRQTTAQHGGPTLPPVTSQPGHQTSSHLETTTKINSQIPNIFISILVLCLGYFY